MLSESVEEESEHSGEGGVSATPEAEGEGLTDTPSVAEAGEAASAPPSEVDAMEPSVAQNGVTEHMTEMKEDEDDEEIPEGDDDEGLVRLLSVVVSKHVHAHTHTHTHIHGAACSQRCEPLSSGAVLEVK